MVKDAAEEAVEAVKSVVRVLNPLNWCAWLRSIIQCFTHGEYVMAKYKSVGTIRYEYEGEGPAVKWFFVPDANYCVMQHHKKDYAVFLGEGISDVIKRELTQTRESGVELTVPSEEKICKKKVLCLKVSELLCLSGAQSAAMTQSKVMVTVEDNGNGLSLIGVSPPPPK